MTEATEKAAPQRDKALWRCVLAMVLLCLLLLVYMLYDLALDRAVEREFQRLEAAGYPTTLKEVRDSRPLLPESQNAATHYLAATRAIVLTYKELSESPFNRYSNIAPWESWNSQMVKAYADFEPKNVKVFEEVEAGARLPQGQYNTDFTQPEPAAPLNYISSLAMILRADAEFAIEHKQLPRALHDVELLVAMARSLDNEATSYSQRIRIAVFYQMFTAVELILNRNMLGDADLDRIEAALNRISFEQAMKLSLLTRPGEARARNFIYSDSDEGSAPSAFINRAIGLDRIGLARFLAATRHMLDASRLEPVARHRAIDAVRAQAEALPFVERNVRQLIVDDAFWAAFIDKAAMGLQCLHIALAVERYRNAHEDRMPESIDELSPRYLPSVPTDVYSGKPLQYIQRLGGYVVYSVGYTGRNKLGENRYDDPTSRNSDIALLVRRASAATQPSQGATTLP